MILQLSVISPSITSSQAIAFFPKFFNISLTLLVKYGYISVKLLNFSSFNLFWIFGAYFHQNSDTSSPPICMYSKGNSQIISFNTFSTNIKLDSSILITEPFILLLFGTY
eukprot:TRINITY_DN656_c0_g1_i2.p4 TRINITY_DN656_c0_g1~~TRINITY_DN656_c0_g1_i2.p4  ORF type:complete len:110 (-),score=1.19 TRINITY_DN656_c0_g1_i2:500-829(-)